METGAVMPIPAPERATKKSRFSGTHRMNRAFTRDNFSSGKLFTLNFLYRQSRVGFTEHTEQLQQAWTKLLFQLTAQGVWDVRASGDLWMVSWLSTI